MRFWEWILLVLCLILFAAQAAFSASTKSATFDEEYHITRGYAYLRTGDFRMSFSHPPLVNAWSSLPLLWFPEINLPLDHQSWEDGNLLQFADEFLWRANENPGEIVAAARLPVIALGLLLIVTMFWWTRMLAGASASALVLILATFDPNLLANSRLATNDLGLTCFLLLAIWRLWCWLERPSRMNIILAGLFAGATMATKYSGLMVWPIIFFIMLIYPGYTHRRLIVLASMGIVACILLWAVYLFDFGPLPGSVWSIPIPAPFYISNLWGTFVDFEVVSRPAFLLGQVSDHGWWYYFPVALAVKNAVPLLVLSALGIYPLLRLLGPRRASVLWLPFLFFLALGMSGRLSIGYRHILPGIPFLIIIASYTILWREILGAGRRLVVPIVVILLFWYVAGTVNLFPHYEAFFNELAGGPANGHRILVDSNLDWGQDLPALKQLMEEQGLERVNLSYFGTAVPEQHGINYQPLPSFPRFLKGREAQAYNPYTPPPGWYAISATSLRLGLYLQNRDLYAFFRDMEPVAQAGYSINLYEVQYPEETSIKRDVIIDQAVWDMPAEQFSHLPDQRLALKWTQSANTEFTRPEANAILPANLQAIGAEFGEALSLLGFVIDQPQVNAGEGLAMTMVWQVLGADIPMPSPTTADPLAVFVHIASVGDASDIVAQYDGWETAWAGLEAGDIIIQNIQIQIPEDTPSGLYRLYAGLYSPQSWERLLVTTAGETADSVSLSTITIVGDEGQ